ncbi:exonuclease SbcCD subunit D [Actinomyces mediterranea]|uniref:exonuclease SbcCD subunit D n=1 Tax=Actinomyces mediterranea TaxID=1871028 RepID=UPI0009712BFD|nr:exonuclease SbcCD subunit D [Actinomyces mediterranea]
MRILHTSDWHIGRTLHGADLSESVDAFFEWLIGLVNERDIDCVLISGDLFDRAVPPVDAIMRASAFLERLCERTRVVITSGNHDGPARLGLFSHMLDERLVVATGVEGIGTPVEHGSEDGCLIYPIPYLEPDLVRQALSDLDPGESGSPAPLPRSHEAVVAAALRRVRADIETRRAAGDERPAIAMVHAFISGALSSDSERDIEVGGAGAISADLFDSLGGDEPLDHGLDYVAAGHLHRPQVIGGARVPIRYSGSPIAYSFSESGADKSVVVLSTSGTGIDSIDGIPIPCYRPVAVLTGTMSQLLSHPDPALVNAYCAVTVIDDARPQQMVARIRAVYPHALVVQHQSPRVSSIPAGARDVEQRSPGDISADFFESVTAAPLTDAERQVIADTWTALRTGAVQ